MEHVSAIKSTNDRSGLPPAQLARLLGWLDRLSPAWAARAALPLFMTPRRYARPAAELAILPSAELTWLRVGRRNVPIYSWGAGPVVLFAHGWEGRGSQVQPFVEPLLERGFRVVSFDQPGHGEAAGARMTVVDFSRTIQAVVAQLGHVHAAIGHSVGGTALAMARSQHRFGARFATIASPLHPREFLAGFTHALALSKAAGRELAARLDARYGLDFAGLDLRNTLHTIDAPALVVHDRGDREVPLYHGQELAAHWPGAQLLVTEGLGHRRVLRDPGVVKAVVELVSSGPSTSLEQEIDQALFAREQRLVQAS